MTQPPIQSFEHRLLRFTCHFCGIELEVPMELGGETAPCPSCGILITAPAWSEAMAQGVAPVASANAAQWEAVLSAQREEIPDLLAGVGRGEQPPIVGVGQIIPTMQSVVQGEGLVTERTVSRKRGVFFPLTVTLLSGAIVGLSAMLLWRSELWRSNAPGEAVASFSRAGSLKNLAVAETGKVIQERATAEVRGMADAASLVVASPPNPAAESRKTVSAPASRNVVEASEPVLLKGKDTEEPKLASVEVKEPESPEGTGAAMAPESPVAAKAPDAGDSKASEKASGVAANLPETKVAVVPPADKAAEAAMPREDEKAPETPRPEVAATSAQVGVEMPSSPTEPAASSGAPSAAVIPVAGMGTGDSKPAVVGESETKVKSGADEAEASTALDRAKEAIRRFLEAEHWQERIPFIFDGESKQSAIRDYFQNHPDKAVKDYRLDFFHSEAAKEGSPSMFVFFLTLAQEEDGFPVIVKSDRSGKKFGVDWDLHVEFKDRYFAQFVQKKEEGAHEFRVVIQRVTYWEEDRDQIPGIEDLVCYKIDPPYPGYTQYAFVEKGSDEGKRMVEALSWEADPLAAKVRVAWAKFANGRSYLRVTDLVARSWAG